MGSRRQPAVSTCSAGVYLKKEGLRDAADILLLLQTHGNVLLLQPLNLPPPTVTDAAAAAADAASLLAFSECCFWSCGCFAQWLRD